MEGKISNQTENIIVAVIAGLLCIVLYFSIGIEGIKFWLTTPIEWKEPDYLTVKYYGLEEVDGTPKLTFFVSNTSNSTVSAIDFYVINEGGMYRIINMATIKPYEVISFSERPNKNYNKDFLDALKKKNGRDIKYRFKEVIVRDNEELSIKNNGWMKIGIMIALSVIAFFIMRVTSNPVLRIILKLLCIPALFVVAVLALALGGTAMEQSGGSIQSEGDIYRNAEITGKYRRASDQRAGAMMHGTFQHQANAQRNVDYAFADMMSNSKNADAVKKYKQAADQRAGAVKTGNITSQASAQRQMDSALADILSKKE